MMCCKAARVTMISRVEAGTTIHRRRRSRYVPIQFGDGADTIQDTAVQSNRLVFGEGITAESVRLDVAPNDSLVLRVGNGGDMVQITGFGPNAPEFHSIRQFEFADGTVLTDAELLCPGFPVILSSSGGSLQGTTLPTIFKQKPAADWLYGRDGNDVAGWQGDDALEGGEGDDELDGGDETTDSMGTKDSTCCVAERAMTFWIRQVWGDQLFGGTGDDAYHLRATGQPSPKQWMQGVTRYTSPD